MHDAASQAGFEDLARRHVDELRRHVRSLGPGAEDAADLVQKSLVKAWAAWRSGGRPERPRAWLHRIVRHETLNHLRDAGTRERRLRDWAPPEPPAGLDADLDAALRAVREVPEPFGPALRLHFLEGLSIAEVAEVLDVPSGTAKSQIARGLAFVRDRIGGRT